MQCAQGPREEFIALGANHTVTGRRFNLCPGSEHLEDECWGCGHWTADGHRMGTGAPVPYDPATNYMATNAWRIDAKIVMVYDSGHESRPAPYDRDDMNRRAMWFERVRVPLRDYTQPSPPISREALILHRDRTLHIFSRVPRGFAPPHAVAAAEPIEDEDAPGYGAPMLPGFAHPEGAEEYESESAEGGGSEGGDGEEGEESEAGGVEHEGEEDDETFSI